MFTTVSELAGIPAGVGLLAALLALDASVLSEGEQLSVARDWERQDRFVSARRNLLYAAFDSSQAPPWQGQPVVSSAQGWLDLVAKARTRSLAGSTGISNTAAAQRIGAASMLTGWLADTGAALEQGLISEACARLIARSVSGLDHDTALAVQYAVLDLAPDLTPAKLDRLLRREVAQRAALDEQGRNRRARRQRRVGYPRPLTGGMASLEVVGPAEDVAVLHTAISALGDAALAAAKGAAHDASAARNPGNSRVNGVEVDGPEVEGIDAHRFDALVNLACGVLADDDLPSRHGRRPSIQVVVPIATLLGLDEAPGELDGYGPIDADTARAIAFDGTATWRRLLVDPQGRVLEYGTETYRPPQALKDLIIARDRSCTGPGCSTPARMCQIDHETPFPRGSTGQRNNDAKCVTEHALKTARLFDAARDPDTGATVWTDRHGANYTRLPETVPLAVLSDDRLADIARALRQGRHRVADLRRRSTNRRGGRIAGRMLNAEEFDPDDIAPDDPPPF
ncbi:MAG: hypothetical protein JWN61_1308 [Pseudonocardiales bacterium]|nr:hypothetical protein [Pseudonocardiales bacterium]